MTGKRNFWWERNSLILLILIKEQIVRARVSLNMGDKLTRVLLEHDYILVIALYSLLSARLRPRKGLSLIFYSMVKSASYPGSVSGSVYNSDMSN